jgi:trk system potassium uptake protein TrkH
VGLLEYVEERLSPPQIVLLSFLSLILVGTLVLSLPLSVREGNSLSFLDALFTATSAVCVTGLVVVDTGTIFSRFGQVMILVLIQVGGLGLMTMTTLYWLFRGHRIKLRERLLVQEALNLSKLAGVVRLVRSILVTTFFVEALGAALLSCWFVPRLGPVKGVFFGLFHSISAFCNAGFDLLGGFRSFTSFPEETYLNLVLMGLILLGGLGFTVLIDLYQYRRFRRLSLHSNVVLSVTGGLLLAGFVLFLFLEGKNPATLGSLTPWGRFLAASFQSVTPRTAGISTIPVKDMRQETQFFLIILMFIGASPGSTGGGIKTATLGTLLAAVWSVATGSQEIDIFHRRLPHRIVFKSLAIVIMDLGILIIAVILLSLVEGKEFMAVFFEAASALGTVGLSTGLTPNLTPLGKVILIVTMFSGRVGPLTLAVALGLRERRQAIRYPEERIIVG